MITKHTVPIIWLQMERDTWQHRFHHDMSHFWLERGVQITKENVKMAAVGHHQV
jgi:hypothetical protein